MVLKRKDPLTNVEFTPRRSNQIHLSSRNRSLYWNQKYKDEKKPVEQIMKQMYLNRKVLNSVMGNMNERTINVYYLYGKGLHPDSFTSQKIINGTPQPCYFEFIIIPTQDKDFVKIKRLS